MKRNWEIKKLEEICKVDWGNTKLTKLIYKDSGNPVFSASGQDGYADFYEHEGEAVILSAIGAQAGKVFFASGKWTAIKNTIIIKPIDKEVNARFVFYFLSREKIWKRSGSGQPFISLEAARKQSIILPPFPIQQKIVRILDTIQEAIDIQEKIIEKTKELKKSLMAELFRYGGPSFRKGRKLKKTEIGEIPEDWEVVRLREVAREIIYGISKKGEKEGKYPILRMNNLEDGKINCKDLQFVSLESSEFEKFKLENGDILFNRTNSLDLVGKTALFTLDGDFVFASYLLRIRTIKDQLLPEYLNYYFNFEKTQQDLKSLASRGASQVNISASKLSNFPIPLPPLLEQREIVEILQTIDQKIEIEKRKKELYEELFKTMLNKIMNQEIDVEKIEV
jgi:type I restriction enzyme, S subunit